MHIAMVCYPTVGGSGVVATELGKHLARRGHQVHFVSSDTPFRLRGYYENIRFHQVDTPSYYVFKDSPYILALANKLLEVHRRVGLDVIHAHYAVPHATAAYLAREMIGECRPAVITTLHGTDITLMGAEPSFADSIAFAINQSDGVTAVSEALVEQTYATLPITRDVQHIPNFVDCEVWYRQETPGLRSRLAEPGERLLIHMSNFRPVKRADQVIEIFAGVVRRLPARLVLLGDGPDVPRASALAQRLGIKDRVLFLGNQEEVVPLLSASDLFLLPSEQESFGLAALEAMACGVPVVASAVGGVPEVVIDGACGFLRPVGDVPGMVEAAVAILSDPVLQRRMSAAGAERAHTVFCHEAVVPRYQALYDQAIAAHRTC